MPPLVTKSERDGNRRRRGITRGFYTARRYSAYESRVNYGEFCAHACGISWGEAICRPSPFPTAYSASGIIEKFPRISRDYDLRCTPVYVYSFSQKENIFLSPIVHYVNLTFLRGQREAPRLTPHSVAFRFSYLSRRARWFPPCLLAHDKTAYHGNEDLCHFPARR